MESVDYFKSPPDGELVEWVVNGRRFQPPEFYITGKTEQEVHTGLDLYIRKMRNELSGGDLYATARAKRLYDTYKMGDDHFFVLVSFLIVPKVQQSRVAMGMNETASV